MAWGAHSRNYEVAAKFGEPENKHSAALAAHVADLNTSEHLAVALWCLRPRNPRDSM